MFTNHVLVADYWFILIFQLVFAGSLGEILAEYGFELVLFKELLDKRLNFWDNFCLMAQVRRLRDPSVTV